MSIGSTDDQSTVFKSPKFGKFHLSLITMLAYLSLSHIHTVSATNPLYTMTCLINNTTDINGGVGDLGTQDVTWTVNGAVASQSVNDVFSATYNNYLILFNNLTMSSDGWMNMRMRVSAADETGANYRYQELSASSTTVAGARATGQTAWANINYAQTGNQNPNTLTIFNPFATSPTSIVSSQAPVSNGNIEVFAKSFGLNTTTSYTGFSFYPASAGPTLTGSVSVYGYNK